MENVHFEAERSKIVDLLLHKATEPRLFYARIHIGDDQYSHPRIFGTTIAFYPVVTARYSQSLSKGGRHILGRVIP
jgi:hypothetical protein